MRILSVLTYYHPHWTGLTAHARQLAQGLAARGHQVSVLTQQHDPNLPATEWIEGVRVERVRPMVRISRGMLAPGFGAAAARLIREHDAVIINTPMFEAGLVAMLARRHSRPVLMVHHGDLRMPAGAANRVVERVTVTSMVAAARLAQRITTYNDDYGEHSDFLLPFRPKLVTIAPPVEIPVPDHDAATAWRGELGLADRKVIGFAGRFVEEKGGDLLLMAMPEILAAEPSAHLLFAAESNVVYERFFDSCEALLAPLRHHITWLGLLTDRQRLANFYAACDVLALPSRSDCFALVQAEAMLCGTPVVASNIPGAREAVRKSGMGLLVEPCNPRALAAGLLEVLKCPQAFRRPAADIHELFDQQPTIDGYAQLLEEMIRKPSLPLRAQTPVCARKAEERLAAADRPVVQRLLHNEADMAFKRRTLVLLDYLGLEDGDRVLDGGCGMGFALMVMAALRSLQLTGIDRDRERLELARQSGAPACLLSADLEGLPFAPAAFDKILLSEVLEHVEDDGAALREAYRVLRPGGTLAISVPHANFPWAWDPINKLWTGIGGAPIRSGPLVGIWSLHRRLYWPKDLVARVAAAGFEIEQVENATHYSVPFAHFLVYGIGKPLIERGWLPASWRQRADRMTGTSNPSSTDLFALGRNVLTAFDRRNDQPAVERRQTFVNVLLKARKPSG